MLTLQMKKVLFTSHNDRSTFNVIVVPIGEFNRFGKAAYLNETNFVIDVNTSMKLGQAYNYGVSRTQPVAFIPLSDCGVD